MAAPPSTSTVGNSLSSLTISTSTGSISTVVSSSSTPQLTSALDAQSADGVPAGLPVPSTAIPAQPTSTATENGNTDVTRVNQTTLIGIIAGAAGLLLLVFLLATLYIIRRRRKRGPAESGDSSSSEENQIPQKRPSVSRGHSQEQPPRRSTGEGQPYEAVGFGTGNSALLATPTYYKDPSSEATTPNQPQSVTLENDTQEGEIKEETPLDPFSSGYVPPPSPTPSEYVIVEHAADQSRPSPTLRDKRESHASLLDTIVPEEPANGFATLSSIASGRTSSNLAHRRTRSGGLSSSGRTTPPPKRSSNRLQKPRPSIESTSSSFLRSTSPTSPRNAVTPIAFPRDPFEASLEGESSAPLRPSVEKLQGSPISHEMREADSQSTQRPSISTRLSLDTVGAGTGDKSSYPRKKSHVRSPSSPTRLLLNSPSFLSVSKRGPSSSALSLQNVHEHERPNEPNAHSATMADASVYDFDIYRQPPDEPKSHPPPSSAARLSAALDGDGYGNAAAKKRFSASMSDLPSAGFVSEALSRWPGSVSTNEVHLHGMKPIRERRGLEPTTNLYIPRESLDLPPS